MKYVNVVIDNKSNSTDMPYTYACSFDDVGVGSKVFVPFARSKTLREGYVISFADESSIDDKMRSRIKSVDHISDEISLNEEMINTAIWMHSRYICRYIDAIKCFLPAGAKAKRRAQANPLKEADAREPIAGELTEEQKDALFEIGQAVQEHSNGRFLIHGVTGSGKTEVYIRSAEMVLGKGRGVIILVPEISLTTQIIERFLGYFGEDSVAVLHSRLSLGERYDQWQKIRNGEVRIVIGARSAAFAPVENLGLIVIDEEHESTYKSDFTPKYDTVEVAVKRLQDKANEGVLLLGSATPSVVSYRRSREGIYKLLKLTKRYNEIRMPESEVVDMRQELKDGNRSVFSRRLLTEIKKQIGEGSQVILLMNRRGYSTFVSCRECGFVAKCPNCGLSLTYHRASDSLECHYCGHIEKAPVKCPECGSRYVRYFGSGTEKVEDEIRELLPDVVIDRVDLDSVKKKGELNRKLKAFEKGKTDILIGTQLIAKGLDFKNVGLVGIISADVSLNIPDYRSPERAFQLITQAAGRAGRGDKEGRVIIQTYNPEHYAVQMAAQQDYESFYSSEIKFRNLMVYPPFSDIFQIVFTSDKEEDAKSASEMWYGEILNQLPQEEHRNVFSPQEAYMGKIRDVYRFTLVMKCPRGKRYQYSDVIWSIRDQEKKKKLNYNAVVDINPYSFT